MIRRRGVWRATARLVTGALLFAVAAPAFAEAPGADSPQALVDRMMRAGETEDPGQRMREVMACLAPEARVEMASMMYLMATMMVGFSMMGVEMGGQMAEGMAEGMGAELTAEEKAEMEAQKEEARGQVAELQEAYNAMVSKYGLPELTEEGEPPDEDVDAVFREIDQAAFVQDVMVFLESMPGEDQPSAPEEDAPWALGDGTLTDLVIEGDTATGKVDGEEVKFVRVDDRWYFDAELLGGPEAGVEAQGDADP